MAQGSCAHCPTNHTSLVVESTAKNRVFFAVLPNNRVPLPRLSYVPVL